MNPADLAIWKYFAPAMSPYGLNGLSFQSFPIVLRDYDGSNNMIYIGIAPRGSVSSDSAWLIRKFIYTGSNLTSETTSPPNSIYDDRASLTYA